MGERGGGGNERPPAVGDFFTGQDVEVNNAGGPKEPRNCVCYKKGSCLVCCPRNFIDFCSKPKESCSLQFHRQFFVCKTGRRTLFVRSSLFPQLPLYLPRFLSPSFLPLTRRPLFLSLFLSPLLSLSPLSDTTCYTPPPVPNPSLRFSFHQTLSLPPPPSLPPLIHKPAILEVPPKYNILASVENDLNVLTVSSARDVVVHDPVLVLVDC